MADGTLVWIVPARVALASPPEGREAFAALRGGGVRALINLGAAPLPFDHLSRFGFQTEHIPVPGQVAPSPAQLDRVATAIRWYLSAGMPVAVLDGPGSAPEPGAGAGGRAGTAIAGYLVAEGATPEEAAEAVERAAPGAPGGPSRRAALEVYALHVRPPTVTRDGRRRDDRPETAGDPATATRPPTGPAGRPALSDPDGALRRLLEGNRRYAADRMEHPRQSASRRNTLTMAQHPFAAVLGCSDSRVPAEIVFDKGLGDLFVVRSAGPVLDGAVVGSLEFAVDELAVPLLLVLVHERCGAARAAVAATRGEFTPPGSVARVTEAIAPAVREAGGRPGDLVENTVRAHAARVVDELRGSEPVLAPAVAAGRLRVVGARYDLDSGLVEVIVP